MTVLRLGTRASPLALIQAGLVRDALVADGHMVEVVPMRTTGDRVLDRPTAAIGGKAVWTKELDRALLDREIDLAVHSMKDVETFRPDAIAIAAMLPRADVRDRLVGAASFAALPPGARIGTGSPRRAAQVRRIRPDLVPVLFRGNVDTRLGKLAAGEAEATLLAAAGLERLARDEVGVPIATDQMLPAPAQGAVGIEVRRDDAATHDAVAAIGDAPTIRCVLAERALLAALHADCHSPVAALARIDLDTLTLDAEVLAEDGSAAVRMRGDDPAALAEALLAASPDAIRRLFGR